MSLLFFSISFFSLTKLSFEAKSFQYFLLLLVLVFDGFSQLIGQLFGKHKIIPKVSPNKTFEGLVGGIIFTIFTAFILKNITNYSNSYLVIYTLVISFFAFFGDISASFIKRKFKVKDFSNLIPQHGGFLDRFDSLIFSSNIILIQQFLRPRLI